MLAGIAGGIAGLASYGLYEIEVVSSDTGASLILLSILCALTAIPIGLAGARWARRRGDDPALNQAAFFLGIGILGAWFVVLVYALGN